MLLPRRLLLRLPFALAGLAALAPLSLAAEQAQDKILIHAEIERPQRGRNGLAHRTGRMKQQSGCQDSVPGGLGMLHAETIDPCDEGHDERGGQVYPFTSKSQYHLI